MGCRAEAIMRGGDRIQHLVRDVIEKNRPIRQAAKQVQPDVADGEREICGSPHGRLIAWTLSKMKRGPPARRPAAWRRLAASLQPGEPYRLTPGSPRAYGWSGP